MRTRGVLGWRGTGARRSSRSPSTSNPASSTSTETRWNRAFRTGVTAASDCHFREVWDIAGPGEPTTWVFAADRTIRSILDALRAGRTTVSNVITGPFLTIEGDLDGGGVLEAMGGDEVIVPRRTLPSKASLRVRVQRGQGTHLLCYAAPGRSARAGQPTAGSPGAPYSSSRSTRKRSVSGRARRRPGRQCPGRAVRLAGR
jgi:hypothetical protein